MKAELEFVDIGKFVENFDKATAGVHSFECSDYNDTRDGTPLRYRVNGYNIEDYRKLWFGDSETSESLGHIYVVSGNYNLDANNYGSFEHLKLYLRGPWRIEGKKSPSLKITLEVDKGNRSDDVHRRDYVRCGPLWRRKDMGKVISNSWFGLEPD